MLPSRRVAGRNELSLHADRELLGKFYDLNSSQN
jgi:hypothetical protein